MPGEPDESMADDTPETSLPDDRLRLFFTCCHPALASETQVALTLRTLGGLTTPEVARAFLASETAMQQRLVRAKRKIRAAAHSLRGASRSRAARPPALGACRGLPDLQRGLSGHERRQPGPARPVRRGDPPRPPPGRAHARRERSARPSLPDAAAPFAPRRPRRRRRRPGAARRSGSFAVAPRRDRRGPRPGRRAAARRTVRAAGRHRRRARRSGDRLGTGGRSLRAAARAAAVARCRAKPGRRRCDERRPGGGSRADRRARGRQARGLSPAARRSRRPVAPHRARRRGAAAYLRARELTQNAAEHAFLDRRLAELDG